MVVFVPGWRATFLAIAVQVGVGMDGWKVPVPGCCRWVGAGSLNQKNRQLFMQLGSAVECTPALISVPTTRHPATFAANLPNPSCCSSSWLLEDRYSRSPGGWQLKKDFSLPGVVHSVDREPHQAVDFLSQVVRGDSGQAWLLRLLRYLAPRAFNSGSPVRGELGELVGRGELLLAGELLRHGAWG